MAITCFGKKHTEMIRCETKIELSQYLNKGNSVLVQSGNNMFLLITKMEIPMGVRFRK